MELKELEFFTALSDAKQAEYLGSEAWYEILHKLSDSAICELVSAINDLTNDDQEVALGAIDHKKDIEFNPLENGAQSLALMKKFEVIREYEYYDHIGFHYHLIYDKQKLRITERQFFGGEDDQEDFTTEKAVCLAILLSKTTPDILRGKILADIIPF